MTTIHGEKLASFPQPWAWHPGQPGSQPTVAETLAGEDEVENAKLTAARFHKLLTLIQTVAIHQEHATVYLFAVPERLIVH